MNYQIEYFPCKTRVVIHVDTQLTERQIDGYTHSEMNSVAPVPAWVRHVLAIPGVTGTLFVHPYDVTVERGQLFSWDDILPLVVFAIHDGVSPESPLVHVPSRLDAVSGRVAQAVVSDMRAAAMAAGQYSCECPLVEAEAHAMFAARITEWADRLEGKPAAATPVLDRAR